jgi:CPA1 family monovalent cation:H+ antiporter
MSAVAQTILAFFTLLMLSIGAYLAAPRLRLPYTVLLVLVGLLLVPLSRLEAFEFLAHFRLTPDTLFFIFLPILIFESAYRIDIRDIGENAWSISLLSVASLLISAFFIAFAGYWALVLVGIELPFLVLLLFGALISATDPVAVLALFKEFGAPKRLSLIFEGESLFNDGTALALFLVVLEVALKGFQGVDTVRQGIIAFVTMLAGGILFGLVMGKAFSGLLRLARHEHLQLTVTLAAAHLTFLLSELISSHVVILDQPIRLSSIIATVIASVVLGAEGRYTISPGIQDYMERFWSYAAFVANSLVFILLGLMFSTLSVAVVDMIVPTLVIILIVIVGRLVSVYPVIGLLNALRVEAPIPRAWQKLLAWGSFRGALAVMMVLLIPDDYVPEGWRLEPSAREFIMALTIGCIYFTIFIKATTMSGILRRFRITDMRALESLEYQEGKVYLHARALLRLLSLEEKPYVDHKALAAMRAKHAELYRQAYADFARKARDSSPLFERVLRIHAIGIEKRTLKGLFANGELSETAYRWAAGKLDRQFRSLESRRRVRGAATDGIPFGLAARLRRRFGLPERTPAATDLFLYYRAMAIAANEVVQSFSRLAEQEAPRLFEADAVFAGILAMYRDFQERAIGHADALVAGDRDLEREQVHLVEREIAQAQALSLEELESSEVISAKVKSVLADEFCR